AVVLLRTTGSIAPIMPLLVINLGLTFAVPGIAYGGHLGGLAGGTIVALAYEALRERRAGVIASVAAAIASGVAGGLLSSVEVGTGICQTTADARGDLEEVRRGLAAKLAPMGLRLGSSATHPYSLSENQRITSRDRYRFLLEQLQYVARRELVFGMHVHV